ncbi:hypothetical protein [Streptomyces sp. H27-H1]|uniref:hypothetical protein n=1 Tax=Streptomyces sp. H27-H1 TaxID=2996461 RepID=UPI002D1E48AF|nr:hypothetical protein [Streptomyces sp. H27-H1]
MCRLGGGACERHRLVQAVPELAHPTRPRRHLNRPLPAFDIALRRYWEHQHPGEPLEEYLHRGGLASEFGKALPQQMQSALGDVAQALLLPGTVGSAVGQLTGP